MFLLPLPPSLSPSIIHPHIIAEQFKLWPTTCNLLRGKREGGRESGRVGGLQRPADYVTPPVVRISPRHNTTAVASASSPTNSAAVCVYCSGVINGTHLAPRVPDGAERQGRQRRAGAGGRGRRGGKIGRIYQPQIGRKREGKGSPTVDPSAAASVCPFPDDCFRVVRRGGIPIIPNRSPICLDAVVGRRHRQCHLCGRRGKDRRRAFSFG